MDPDFGGAWLGAKNGGLPHVFDELGHCLRCFANAESCDYPCEEGFDFGVVVVHLIQPEITTWRVTWTPQELNNLWAETLDRANALESMIAADDLQPFQHRLGEWECVSCSRSLTCQLEASVRAIGK